MSCVSRKSEEERHLVKKAMDRVYEAYKLRMLDAAVERVCPTCHASLEVHVMVACLIEHSGYTLVETEHLVAAALKAYEQAHLTSQGKVIH